MTASTPTDRQRCPLGPGPEAAVIQEALACLSRDPEVERLVLSGSRTRGEARADSDLDLLLILRGSLTPQREKRLHRRVRALLRPLLPVDLDLRISDAAITAHWAGFRWPVLGHIHRDGIPLHAS